MQRLCAGLYAAHTRLLQHSQTHTQTHMQIASMSPKLFEDAIDGIWECMKHDQRAVRKAALNALPAIVAPGHPAMAEGVVRGLRDEYSETKKLAVSLIGCVCVYALPCTHVYVCVCVCVYVCMYTYNRR
jgi:hypothetical protein